MQERLQSWAAHHWQGPVEVSAVQDLSGHSGQTFGFTVTHGGASQALVIRVAPPGVPRRGSTDVLRQVPLHQELKAQGVRVPAVVAWGDDEQWFGAPFMVVERLPGRPLIMGPDAGPAWLPAADRQRAHELAAEQLGVLHRTFLTPRLRAWSAEQTLVGEIDFWAPMLARCGEAAWMEQGEAVRQRLLASCPDDPVVGVFHGDYQTNNLLFEGSGDTLRVTGIVDWEIAGIGSTELDIAWLLMMNDEQAWDPVELRGNLDLDGVLRAYEAAVGRRVQHLDWYWALACYRIAAIAAYNIRLHRNGRRLDEAWERCASSVPRMLQRAAALLEH